MGIPLSGGRGTNTQLHPVLGDGAPGHNGGFGAEQISQCLIAEGTGGVFLLYQFQKLLLHSLPGSAAHGSAEKVPKREDALPALQVFAVSGPGNG